MRLSDLNINSLIYLERYVNNGSPSGFTTKFMTSEGTRPFDSNNFFYPLICEAPKSFFKDYGFVPQVSELLIDKESNWIIVHPDMKDEAIFKSNSIKLYQSSKLKLAPTASGRTLKVIESSVNGYFKLHYSGIIGRIKRDLTLKKAIAGPEISELFIKLINQNKLDSRLNLLPETGSRTLINKELNQEWGMIWRNFEPYAFNSLKTPYLIPFFSLFGKDLKNPEHPTLLEQIIDFKSVSPKKYIVNGLILPIIDCYFSVLTNSGIQPEWHAQNLLLTLDSKYSPVQFVMRDLESMDKDLTLIEQLKLNIQFKSAPFKCIDKSQYNYYIKHSFMYDYKLGEYIIQPLLDFLEEKYSIKTNDIIKEIKSFVQPFLKLLPSDFFPSCWYVFEPVLIDQSRKERPYVELNNPKFR